jgi:hypothetical protein
MKYEYPLLLILLVSITAAAQTNLTTANALYFSSSGNAPDGFPQARFNENWASDIIRPIRAGYFLPNHLF